MNTSQYVRAFTAALEGDRNAAESALLEARRRMHKLDTLTMWIAAYGPVVAGGYLDRFGVSAERVKEWEDRHRDMLINAGPFGTPMDVNLTHDELLSTGALVVVEPSAEGRTMNVYDIGPELRDSPFKGDA